MSNKVKITKMNQNKQELVPKLRFPEFRDSGEWKEKSLKDLFTIGSGRDYKHLDNGKIPVYGTGGYMLSVNDYLYDGESVCIGRKGTIDKPVLLTGKFWTVYTLFYTHSFKECLPRFVLSIFQNIDWKKHNEAGGVPSLSKTNIEKLNVVIPKLKEQQKIADCLSSIDDLITAESKKLESIKNHKKGLMQNLFPSEGKTTPNFRFPEFKNDGEWEVKPLGKICKYSNGGGNENNVVDNGKYYLISLNSIDTEGNLKPNMKRVNHIDNSLIKNDLVMVLSDVAYGNFLGLSAIIPNNNYVLNQRMAGLRVRSNQNINIEYLRLFINNNQKYFKQKGQGSSQQNLSKPSVERFPIFLPNNPKEQQKIADCLSSIDDLITSQGQKIEALKTHKKGLMQQLFPNIDQNHKSK